MEKTIHIQDNFYEEVNEKAIATANKIKAEVAEATEWNDHTGAQIIIAEAFGFQGSLAELKEIKRKHLAAGGMRGDWMHQRNTIAKHMERLIKEISPTAAAILHDAC